MDRKYISFISYCHRPKDKAVARLLHSLIEKYIIPKGLRKNGEKKLGVVFRDMEELAVSSDLTADIQQALDSSEYSIVICSPRSAESEWVQREITHFLKNHERERVLAVLADGEPDNAFPAQLTGVYDGETDTVVEIEPMAVDVRSDSVLGSLYKLRREYKRIIATLLGCPYDALVLREQRRTIRRILTGAVAIITTISLFLGMLWSKNQQIAERNQALAVEKANVQYSRSQLLTEDAEQAAANGDYLTALRLAADALPDENNPDRPYYAPAEAVLLGVMDIFGEKEDYNGTYDRALEQVTEISDFCIAADGQRIVTIDAHGQLLCFDSLDGDELWSAYVRGGDTALCDTVRVIDMVGHGRILCDYRGCLASYDWESGALLWEQPLGNIQESYVVYDARQDVILYVSETTDWNLDRTDAAFCLLSGETGALVQTIPFVQTEGLRHIRFPERQGDGMNAIGCFTAEGDTFVGTFFEREQDNRGRLKLYVLDLAEGSGRVCYEETLMASDLESRMPAVGLTLTDGGVSAVLTVLSQNADGSDRVTVEKIDLTSGTAQWKTAVPVSGAQMLRSDVLHTQVWAQSIWVACGDMLVSVNGETGIVEEQLQLSDAVTWMGTTSDITVGYFLKSGSYGIAWKNAAGLHSMEVELGQLAAAKSYGGGIMQFYADDVKGEYEIAVSNRVSEGYAAVIPLGQENRILIKRPAEKIQAANEAVVKLSVSDYGAEDATVVYADESTVVFGPYLADTGVKYVAVDRERLSVVGTYNAEQPGYDESVVLLPDGKGYLICSRQGGVRLWADGAVTDMAGDETVATMPDGLDFYIYGLVACDSAYHRDDGALLTVRLGAQDLQAWVNGQALYSLPLTEGLAINDRDIRARGVEVYANGRALIWCMRDDTAELGVWNLNEEVPTLRQLHVDGADIAAACIAEELPLLAYADSNDMMQIFDYEQDKAVGSFPLRMPYRTVQDIRFAMEQKVLLVLTESHQLWVYDTETGAVLFRGSVDEGTGGSLLHTEDRDNDRLYVGADGGLCVDTRTWTELGAVDGLLFYDTERDVLYRRGFGAEIICSHIPDTTELTAMAKTYAANE